MYGPTCFDGNTPVVTLRKGYGNQLEVSNLDVNCKEALSHLVKVTGLSQQIASKLSQLDSVGDMVKVLSEAEQTEAVQNLTPILAGIAENGLSRSLSDLRSQVSLTY